MKPVVFLGLALCLALYAQPQFGCVCSTDVPFATAGNNGHKLAARSEMVGGIPGTDSVLLAIQSAESVRLYISGAGGTSWQGPILSYPGHNPAVVWGGDGCRHLVWEMADSAGRSQIYYRNLELRMEPLNVSASENPCHHPDVWADRTGVVHIVWAESVMGVEKIWYRTCRNGQPLGPRFLVSTDSLARCDLPAIENFGDTITVVWQEFVPRIVLPQSYRIMRRCQVNGVWLGEEGVAYARAPLSHPALDFGAHGEGFAAAWDEDVDGNLEVRFIGGNPGGGYPTPGSSTAPVLSHLGRVWSYLYWEEESLGFRDIRMHHYYFMEGWTSHSLRNLFLIDEPVYAPSCLGALLVWTQGSAPPYRVMWAFFDYPVGISEEQPMGLERAGLVVKDLPTRSALIDICGRRVMEFKPGALDGRGLKPGVYFILTPEGRHRKIVVH